MKIYTRTGDKGQTSLYGGTRLSKDDMRIEAYGTVDELNAYLGWIAAMPGALVDFGFFQRIQSQCFNVGSHLAAGEDNEYPLPELDTALIKRMEDEMDRMNDKLPKLKSFVLPGGCVENGVVHVARTVCRRAERRVVTLSQHFKVDPEILIFLNRLSDYLFVLSRYASLKADAEEVPWVGVKS